MRVGGVVIVDPAGDHGMGVVQGMARKSDNRIIGGQPTWALPKPWKPSFLMLDTIFRLFRLSVYLSDLYGKENRWKIGKSEP
jgi:hypothetical protein